MNADIHIHKVNESWIRLDTDASILMEISDAYCFEVPNAKWMKKKRKGLSLWDGKIRLVNPNYATMYSGLLPSVLKFAKQSGYSVSIDKDLYPHPVDKDRLAYVCALPFTNEDGESISFRDYQLVGVKECINFNRRTIVSPTASGKSLMIYGLIRYYLEPTVAKRKKILVIVPNTALVVQLSKNFVEYSQKDPTFSEKLIHQIYDDAEKKSPCPIFVSTWQGIINQPNSFFEQFEVVIGDECHQYKADQIKTIMERSVNAPYRFGFTGTLTADGSQCNKLIIEGLFGSAVKIATTRELMDRKEMSDIQMNMVMLKYGPDACRFVSKIDYQEEIKYIETLRERNKVIVDIANGCEGNTLVLFTRIKHGKLIYDAFKKSGRERVFLISGQNEAEEREEVRKLFEKETGIVVVASTGVFSTGISVNNLHNFIMTSSSKSQIKVLQSIGRGLRLHKTKSHLNAYDFVDDFTTPKKKPNYCMQHGTARMKMYIAEKFDYTIRNVTMTGEYNE